jgi:lysophospholipase L1-like esterase
MKPPEKRATRVLKFVARWTTVLFAGLVLLELMCHVVLLSNDSLPVDLIADPYMSYRMKPSSSGTSALGVSFQINAVSLRNPEITLPKPPGVFRVLVLGDSVTMGYGVPSEVGYTRVLEKLVDGQHIEVINAGTSGHPAADQLAFLEHYGLALEPDMVVVGFTRNNIGAPPKLDIRDGVGYDASNSAFIPPFAKKILRRSRLYLAVGRAKWALGGNHAAPKDDAARAAQFAKDWPAAEVTLQRLTAVCKEHHLPLLMAYIPVQVEVARGPEYPELVEKLSKLGGDGDGYGYGFVNVLPHFVAEKNDVRGLYLPLDEAHPNSVGHRLIARTIFEDPFFRKSLPPGTKFASQ